jgi:hypothetical protein
MLGKMPRSEYTNGRNQEIMAWVEENPDLSSKVWIVATEEIKARIEARIRNLDRSADRHRRGHGCSQ